jgi:hypothetical protein
LYDWNSLCQLADKTQVVGVNHNRRKELQQELESSAPIPLFTSDGPIWLIVKVWFHKIERRKYLDVRAYEKVTYGDHEDPQVYFKPTVMGINLPLRRWVDLFNIIVKYLEKYRKDI